MKRTSFKAMLRKALKLATPTRKEADRIRKQLMDKMKGIRGTNMLNVHNKILIVAVGLTLAFQPGCNKQAEKDKIRQLEGLNRVLEKSVIEMEQELDKADAADKRHAAELLAAKSELDAQKTRYEKKLADERNNANKHADSLVASSKSDADVFKSAMAKQDKRIADLVEENKKLKHELESAKSSVANPASRNQTVAKITSLYRLC